MKRFRFFASDKKIYAVLLFVAFLIIDFLAAVLGFGGALFCAFQFGDLMFSTYESLIVSSLFVYITILMMGYAYRNNNPGKLKALGFANLTVSLLPFVLNSVYYPFVYLLAEAVCDLVKADEVLHFSDLRFYLSEFISVPMCICCFILMRRLKKEKEFSTSRLSFGIFSMLTAILLVFVVIAGYYVCNTPVSEYFNYSVFDNLSVS